MTGTLHEDRYTFLIKSRSVLLGMRSVSDKSCWENQHTYFFSIFFFENVEKCGKTRQATVDNMALAHYMLDTYGYRHTLRMCNTYRFSTVTMVARTRLNVTLYVYCLSCSTYVVMFSCYCVKVPGWTFGQRLVMFRPISTQASRITCNKKPI